MNNTQTNGSLGSIPAKIVIKDNNKSWIERLILIILCLILGFFCCKIYFKWLKVPLKKHYIAVHDIVKTDSCDLSIITRVSDNRGIFAYDYADSNNFLVLPANA